MLKYNRMLFMPSAVLRRQVNADDSRSKGHISSNYATRQQSKLTTSYRLIRPAGSVREERGKSNHTRHLPILGPFTHAAVGTYNN